MEFGYYLKLQHKLDDERIFTRIHFLMNVSFNLITYFPRLISYLTMKVVEFLGVLSFNGQNSFLLR